jgi:ketol-acid reductoisomerase
VFLRIRDELRDSEVTENGVAHGTVLLTAPKVIGSKIRRNFERGPGE